MTTIETPTPCVTNPGVFLHPLLDDSVTPSNRAERREQMSLRARAERMCAECPLFSSCLNDAITKHDVSGFVAGTTKRERNEIRANLDVKVESEDMDTYAGVTSGRQFDRYEIHRMRTANPDQPLSVIAQKVGCSVSTVKRHLRRIEREGLPMKKREQDLPLDSEVLAAARQLREMKRAA